MFPYSQGMMMAASAGEPQVTVVHTADLFDPSSQGVYTFSSVPISDAAADRQVFVIAEPNGNTVTGVTIGGNAATFVASIDSGTAQQFMYKATVAAGATTTVAVTLDVTADWCGLIVDVAYGASTTVHDTATDSDGILSATIDVVKGGAVIGGAFTNSDSGTQSFTWSANMTRKFEEALISTAHHTGALGSFSATQSGVTITCTPSDTSGSEVMVLASLAPA